MSDVNAAQAAGPRWKPLSAIDRRVAGVLVEKAKTTPNAYPLTLNAIVTGCNQKSNRFPLLELDPDAVQESLDRLREMGAVGLVQGLGRVEKFRHYLYDWFGVDKVELAVMAELLLRGAQTLGELRARAARMEPIRDMAELEPVVASLKAKGLVIGLSPEGRGHVVTHALYQPRELERVRQEYRSAPASAYVAAEQEPEAVQAVPTPVAAPMPEPAAAPLQARHDEIAELRAQIEELRGELADLTASFHNVEGQLQQLKDALGA